MPLLLCFECHKMQWSTTDPHAGVPEDQQHDPDKNFILQEAMEDVSSGVPQLRLTLYYIVDMLLFLLNQLLWLKPATLAHARQVASAEWWSMSEPMQRILGIMRHPCQPSWSMFFWSWFYMFPSIYLITHMAMAMENGLIWVSPFYRSIYGIAHLTTIHI